MSHFKKLLAFVKKNKSDKECLICRQSLNTDEVKLKCNHSYHLSCLPKNKTSFTCYYCNQITIYRNIKAKCLFCNKKTLFANKKCSQHYNLNIQKCCAIIRSGSRKGQPCDKITSGKYCKKHLNYKEKKVKVKKEKININKEKNVCQSVLKTGKRKGEICFRINCKYHNKTPKQVVIDI